MSEAAAAGAAPPRGVWRGPHGLRAGWRILLWMIFAAGLAMLALPPAYWLLGQSLSTGFAGMLAGSVGAGWIMLLLIDRRPVGALGFAVEPAAARDSLLGLGLGGGMIMASVLLLALTGGARWLADTGTVPEYAAALLQALAFFAIAAAAEEAVCRGYVFQALVQGIGAWPAVLATSVVFSLGHLRNAHVDSIALANIFLAGVLLGVVYLRTRSLWAATAVHTGWNWVMSAVLDFPVSGLQRDTPLYDVRETAADWWTGGPFGPEAGLASTLVVIAATVWLLRTPLMRESEHMRSLRPLVDSRIGPDWPAAES